MQPDIYGCNVDQRGMYRMWWLVELTILNGRNLGTVLSIVLSQRKPPRKTGSLDTVAE